MRLVAEMTVTNPFDFFVESYAERSGFAYPPELAQDLEPYLRGVDDSVLLSAWLGDHPELTAAGQRPWRRTTRGARTRAGRSPTSARTSPPAPWEDWAESFAHYLHIRDTLQAAASYGIVVGAPDAVTTPDAPLEATPKEDPSGFAEIERT